MRFGSLLCAASLAAAVGVLGGGCTTTTEGLPHPGQGGGGGADIDAPVDDTDGGRKPVATCEPPAILKALGKECGCNEECDSGSCVDGVCCSGACSGTCIACNVPGKMGTCSPIPAGMPPVVDGQCQTSDVSTCGLDGTCDGSGGCRKYPDGTSCKAGVCSGATVTEIKICTAGSCEPGPNMVCAPNACDPATGSCFDKCTDNTQCAAGRVCMNGSCGEKKLGATCQKNTDCESKFCADGFCCNAACTGACESCNQVGRRGTCAPSPHDLPDPHGICKDEGANSCKSSGVCDGSGSCARYAAGTTCSAARCEGGSVVPASTCDGMGSCKGGSPVACAPFVCAGNGCKVTCATNADCVSPNTCINGSCGKKGKGQDCTGNSQCGSNFCVDGVCCESACTGQCKFCASASARGSCLNVGPTLPDPRYAAGERDPTKVCIDKGVAACAENGMCNGNGGCQLYKQGTMCLAESCNAGTNTYSRPSLCDGSGKCVTGSSSGCAPYKCNGPICGQACGGNGDCLSPNTCDANGSCGKKNLKAICNSDAECASGNCEQGLCCATACTGSCFSCATSANPGNCVAVPAGGADPAKVCTDQGPTSCKNNGVCNGSGACQKYAPGTICASAFCANDIEQQTSTCDGLGNCDAGARMACNTFVCNSGGTACYDSCIDDTQCSGDNTCVGNSCGKKGQGAPCSANAQCQSNVCADGFCCDKKCDGLCETCKLSGKHGACLPVPAGTADDNSTCSASMPVQCGFNGLCDGNRACQDWDASTLCRSANCPAGMSTLTLSATCTGSGSCPAVMTQSCGTHKCDAATGNSCLTSCQGNNDCTTGNFCTMTSPGTMTCGLKANGAGCMDGTECTSGKCVDATCCGSSACGTCESCGNPSGTCQPVPLNTSDAACAATGGEPACATPNGKCNATGQCQLTSMGTNCGTACVPSGNGQGTQNLVCNGGGSCVSEMATPASCGSFICQTGQCRTTCTNDGHCTGGTTCQDQDMQGVGTCMPKRDDGAICMEASDCTNGHCVGSFCCASASCGTCSTCASGTCASVTSGTPDAACNPNQSNLCRTGLCGSGGACAQISCGPVCAGGSSQPRVCDGMGGCSEVGAAMDCAPYTCDGTTGGCKGSCQDAAVDCVAGKICDGNGACVDP